MVFDSARIFGGRKTTGPKGYRAYAVGDVHGRLDLLDAMLAEIEADVRRRHRAKTVIVFLGDLIDRGPQSSQVVERLRTYRPRFARTVFLMGNHEEVLLRVLDGDSALLGDWLRFGGAECMTSYGEDAGALKAMPATAAVEAVRRAIPREHADFIRSFADTLSFGSYLFVHAGVRPGVTLSDQAQHDLRWIRQPFLDDDREHGFVVVHGHTIVPEVDERANRIGVDTGAYRTGVLTTLAVEGTERWFLRAGDATGGGADVARGPESSDAPAMAGQSPA